MKIEKLNYVTPEVEVMLLGNDVIATSLGGIDLHGTDPTDTDNNSGTNTEVDYESDLNFKP